MKCPMLFKTLADYSYDSFKTNDEDKVIIGKLSEQIKLTNARVNELKSRIYVLSNEVNRIKEYCDQTDFSRFSNEIVFNITDYATAREAVDTYNLRWFADLPYSNNSLGLLASRLKDTCSNYGKNLYHPVWDRIQNNELGVFDEMVTLREEIENNENIE